MNSPNPKTWFSMGFGPFQFKFSQIPLQINLFSFLPSLINSIPFHSIIASAKRTRVENYIITKKRRILPTMAAKSFLKLTIAASPTIQINDMSDDHLTRTISFLNELSNSSQIPHDFNAKDFIRSYLHHPQIERGRISCIISVKPSICNGYRSLHGGYVTAVADFVSTACARTVVAEDKDIFLGELSVSFLSGAPHYAEVAIDASVIRSGRNLTVVAVEFKLQETGKLLYTARSTFYNMPVAKL